jgi:DNA polymerase III polC-type
MDYKLTSSTNPDFYIHVIKSGDKLTIDTTLLKKALGKTNKTIAQHETLEDLTFKLRTKEFSSNHSYVEWLSIFLIFANRVQKDFVIEDASFWMTTKSAIKTFSSEKNKEKDSKLYNQKVDGFDDTFISLDVETTGLNSTKDSIIQFSAVLYKKGKQVRSFDKFVKPSNGNKISLFTTDLTGIKQEDVDNAETFKEVWDSFISDFYNGEQLVGQNLKFDLNIIIAELEKIGKKLPKVEYADTMAMIKELYPDLGAGEYKLEKLKKRFLPEETANLSSHNSLNDCIIAGELYLFLLEQFKKNNWN